MSHRLVAAVILSMSACTSPPPRSAFEEACDVLEKAPVGTEVREIEKRLALPAPVKTYVGSSLYPFRCFRYVRQDGLFVEIGLFQDGVVEAYPEGRFTTVGHHTIATRNEIWKRWVWTDLGPIEYRGPRGD